MKKNNIALFSGGTGGHVIPAVNFGNYLIDSGYRCSLFLDKRGLKFVKKFKGKIIIINSGHFSGNFFFIFKALINLLFGFIQSFFYLLSIRPIKCIAFGSYASFAPLTICTFLQFFKITNIYLHEQNSVMGKVNLIFTPYSKKVFVNFKKIKKINSRYNKKIFHVGMPNDVTLIYKKRNLNIDNNKIKIFVYGGSQGAVNLNKIFVKLINKLPSNYFKKISIIFQSSKNQIDYIKSNLNSQIKDVVINPFYENINEILYGSDLALSRSGAGTINNIIFNQIPTILVPLPHAIYNHQYYNAKFLINNKSGILIEEKDFNNEKTYLVFRDLIENIDKRIDIIKNLQSIKLLDSNKLMSKEIFNEKI